ncbi:MAG: M48 family metalloprotease [Vulcanisaeta sp.]|jgi:heat shock protein HtpX|nr:M48 family metalloprotease [Vulcanisaeta sp.]
MVAAEIYQTIRELIKDPQSLINYVENYLLRASNAPYITKELNNDYTKLITNSELGNAELSINHDIRIRGHGKAKNLLNALVLRYLGTDGSRKITILLMRRGSRVYRVSDLPKLQSLPLGLISLVLTSLIIMSLIIAVLRITSILPPIHVIVALLLAPLLIPIIYSYIIQVRIRHGDLRNSQIIKFVLEYNDFDDTRFNNALRLLARIESSRSLDEIRRFVLSLVGNPGTSPRNYYEEIIDMDTIMNKLGTKNYGIYLVNMNQCNAASIGLPGINYVILTSRLISCLNERELMAVIMHEVGHIMHGDSAKTLFLISLAQLVNIALITYVIPIMRLPAIPILITAILIELLTITLTMKLSEYAADKYAMRFVQGKDLATALIKVAWRELHNELTSGKIKKLRTFNTHPTVSARLIRIIPQKKPN